MLVIYFFYWVKALRDLGHILDVVLPFLPPYALGGGFLKLATNQIRSDLFRYRKYLKYIWAMPGTNELTTDDVCALKGQR